MQLLDEFLSPQKFYRVISPLKKIDRGFPQGSVLGPALFNLYPWCILNKLPSEVSLTFYADNSYIMITDSNLENLIQRTESCLFVQIGSLEEIEMKGNQSKTEIMLFGKTLIGLSSS